MANSEVYTGVWINHSKGSIQGSTLTFPDYQGTFSIAFLALFTSFAGNQIWVILSYIIFHLRSRQTAQDGLHHQIQATLCNSVSSLSDCWKYTLLAWYWRGKARPVFRRVIPLLLLAWAHCTLIVVASIYATSVVQLPSLVLSRSSVCGDWNWTSNGDWDTIARADAAPGYLASATKFQDEQTHMWEQSANFARLCYSSGTQESSGLSAGCPQYHGMRKKWHNRTDEECPFDARMCKDGVIYSLDTGPLDSASDLGINSVPASRIQYRRKMTCSPLTRQGFVEGPMKANLPWRTNLTIWDFNYGRSADPYVNNYTNATFTHEQGSPHSFIFTMDSWYKLFIATYFPNETVPERIWEGAEGLPSDFTTFHAIPELQADGVTSVLFMVTDVCSEIPINDSWFSFHRQVNIPYKGKPLYCLDGEESTSPLACLEQHEFCNAAVNKCSGLMNTHTQPDYQALSFNKRQSKVAERIFNATSNLGIRGPIQSLGAERTLLARSANGMPSNQWQLELNNWFGIVYAQIQSQLLQWATGPSLASNDKYIVPPTDPDVAWMCNNQLVYNAQYMCFSVLGIALFISLGSVLVLLGWFIEGIARAVQKPLGKGTYGSFEWRWNGTLQLQKSAFEANGLGTWIDDKVQVPVTRKKERWTIPHQSECENREDWVRLGSRESLPAREYEVAARSA